MRAGGRGVAWNLTSTRGGEVIKSWWKLIRGGGGEELKMDKKWLASIAKDQSLGHLFLCTKLQLLKLCVFWLK